MGVILRAHVLFVVNRIFNATPTETLQQTKSVTRYFEPVVLNVFDEGSQIQICNFVGEPKKISK